MGIGAFLVHPIQLFFLPLSGRSPNMNEMLWTGILSLNSIRQLPLGTTDPRVPAGLKGI